MNLKNVELNTAVNALIGSMVRKGYITEANNSILVSVENKDTKKADEICQSIVGDIRQVLDKKISKGSSITRRLQAVKKYLVLRSNMRFPRVRRHFY